MTFIYLTILSQRISNGS